MPTDDVIERLMVEMEIEKRSTEPVAVSEEAVQHNIAGAQWAQHELSLQACNILTEWELDYRIGTHSVSKRRVISQIYMALRQSFMRMGLDVDDTPQSLDSPDSIR